VKSLYWKEWKENGTVILMSALLMAVLFAGTLAFGRYSFGTPAHQVQASFFEPLVLLFWAIPAAMASTPIIASETGSGTLFFLNSLPITRNKIWWVKITTGYCITFLSFIVSGAVFFALFAFASTLDLIASGSVTDLLDGDMTIYIILSGTIIFSAGAIATVVTKRTVNALVLIVIITVFILLIVGEVTRVFTYLPASDDLPAFCASIAVSSTLCLVYSNRTFVLGREFVTSSQFRLVWAPGIFDFLVIFVALIISYLWLTS
jgi:ABC-type transport system involved in multi-copper enzyme maturation permease subunit